MSLSARELTQLRKIVGIAEKLIAKADASGQASVRGGGARPKSTKRARRTGKKLLAFRKMLLTERKRGVSVAELAKKHDISRTYIYQL